MLRIIIIGLMVFSIVKVISIIVISRQLDPRKGLEKSKDKDSHD